MSKDCDKFVFEFMDMLTAPVITHSQSWADCIPKRLLDLISMSRLISGMQKDEMASYPEVVAYLTTASFEAPLGSDWTEIFTHCSCTVCEQHFNEDHWDTLDAHRKLSDYQKEKLDKLRRWIYDKRRKALKNSMRAMKSKEPELVIEEKNIPKQLTLF